VLLGINQATGHPCTPWIQPNHRPSQCSLESTKSPATLVFLGINQVIGHPSAPWNQPSHRSIPVFLGINQVTGHPSAPWNQPSHRSIPVLLGFNQAIGPSQYSLESTKPPATPMLPWNHPSHQSTPVGVVLFHCTHLQCSLHFYTYTLAMQSLVSAFIQHPSKHPSRYIIGHSLHRYGIVT
jgi:hypothetical protein